MLKLENIKKDYITGSLITNALKGISVDFRTSEFVSILGPSGCGKTTLLNIIGGLDRYTSGDLQIKGVSTKNYGDRDWDTYRNHSIGFVFQSYNLIMHESIIGNVELALTLSGVNYKERRARAIEVLKKVGLEKAMYKKPNQLSGGQMQRVAIARALINNPEILLADEPTGALDSETSIQIMELLKEVAKDRLVIMVTHNPELAEKYSTRIIQLRDGLIINDNNPYKSETPKSEKTSKVKKSSMSFLTSLSLSGKNLLTKLGRTLLMAFAGSIGIIGIALILSLSDGFNSYIEKVQVDALSRYPITITEQAVSVESLMLTMNAGGQTKGEEFPNTDIVGENPVVGDLMELQTKITETNDLKSFKTYLESDEIQEKYGDAISSISYNYNVHFDVFKELDTYTEDNWYSSYKYPHTYEILKNVLTYSPTSFKELISNNQVLENQYDVLRGTFPQSPTDVVVILDKYNNLSDYTLASLGLKSFEDIEKAKNGERVEFPGVSFDDIMNVRFKMCTLGMRYKKNQMDYFDGGFDSEEKSKIAAESLIYYLNNDEFTPTIRVSGILRAKKGATTTSIDSGIGYTSDLTKLLIEKNNSTDVCKAQIQNPDSRILGVGDYANDSEKMAAYKQIGLVSEDTPKSISIYPNSFESKQQILNMIDEYNNSVDQEFRIEYTDTVGILMDSVTVIVDSVSYVLIAFVSISLVVSSIMIAIITYVSVIERTKEIGILRSLGASKRNISGVFNAETLIIGLTSGIIGIISTVLLDIPLNLIIEHFTDIPNIAFLSWYYALALIALSCLLTLIAGFVPSKIAAKKDPVVALRTGE